MEKPELPKFTDEMWIDKKLWLYLQWLTEEVEGLKKERTEDNQKQDLNHDNCTKHLEEPKP